DSVCFGRRAAGLAGEFCYHRLEFTLMMVDLGGDCGAGRTQFTIGIHPRAASEVRLSEPLFEVVEHRYHRVLVVAGVLCVRGDIAHHRAVATAEHGDHDVALGRVDLVDPAQRKAGRLPQFIHADCLDTARVEDTLGGIKELIAQLLGDGRWWWWHRISSSK